MLRIKPERLKHVMEHCPAPRKNAPPFVEPNSSITCKKLAAAMGSDNTKSLQNARNAGIISEKNLAAICSLLDVSKDYFLGVDNTNLNTFETYLESQNIVIRTDKPKDIKHAKELYEKDKLIYYAWFKEAHDDYRIDNSGVYIDFNDSLEDDEIPNFDFNNLLHKYLKSIDYLNLWSEYLLLCRDGKQHDDLPNDYQFADYEHLAPYLEGFEGLANYLNHALFDAISKYSYRIQTGKYASIPFTDYYRSLLGSGSLNPTEPHHKAATVASDRTQSPPDRTPGEPEKPEPVKPIDQNKPTK